MREPVIVEAVRTPIGKRNGVARRPARGRAARRCPGRGGQARGHRGVRRRPGDRRLRDASRRAVLQRHAQRRGSAMGLPYEVAATTVDTQCGSSQQANNLIARADRVRRDRRRHRVRRRGDEPRRARLERDQRPRLLRAGRAGRGTRRTSSRPPSGSRRSAASRAPTSTRSGLASQQKAARAWAEGRFDREVFAVEAPEQPEPVTRDQGLRETTAEGLAKLKPVLDDGIHTAGQLVADLRRRRPPCCGWTARRRESLGPAARARGSSQQVVVGTDPYFLLDGPVDATARGAGEGRA